MHYFSYILKKKGSFSVVSEYTNITMAYSVRLGYVRVPTGDAYSS